ncbi:MAG: glycosyltransferase [Terriglobales bacterium]|jgi:glycosyltransferase involved in cell wall biosynthesis
MHVDWGWIKQRPHFLAEGLAANHDVRVLYPLVFRNHVYMTRNETHLHHSTLLPIPWRWRSLPWARALHRRWIAKIAREFCPDIIWVTHPSLLELLPEHLMELPVIYDCMDDALNFLSTSHEGALLAQLEEQLVRRSARILCSSAHLSDVLASRYSSSVCGKISVVRNAVSQKILGNPTDKPKAIRKRLVGERTLKIGYIGTVAEWLDFDLLLDCLADTADVEFHLVGPITIPNAARHERLHYHGPIPHGELVQYVDRFDAHMMPFKMGPLIEAVDPIKLYEYLAFGKEIISIRYREVDRFANFVHFYDTKSEFIQLVRDLAAGKLALKNCPERTRHFLEENTWHQRVEHIYELLDSLN